MQANHSSISSTCLRLEHLSSTPCKTYHSHCVAFCSLQHFAQSMQLMRSLLLQEQLSRSCFLLSLDQLKIALKRCSQWQTIAANLSTSLASARQIKSQCRFLQLHSATYIPHPRYSHSTSISTSKRLQGTFYLFLQIFFQNTTCKLPKLLSTLLRMCHTSVCFWALSKLDESL